MPETTSQTTTTAAPVITTPAEVVRLYELLHETQWDSERKAIKNPTLVMRSLLHYGRLTAARLVDAFSRITGTEAHTAQLEARVVALEAFKADIEVQAAEAQRQFESMAAGNLPMLMPPAQQAPAQQAPAQQPVAQQPVAQQAPVQQPVAQPAPVQQPVAQPAPVQQPVAQPAPVQSEGSPVTPITSAPKRAKAPATAGKAKKGGGRS